MKNKTIIAILTVLALLAVSPVMIGSETDAIDETAVDFRAYLNNNVTDTIDINAGESRTVEVVAWNQTASSTPVILWVKLDDVLLEGSGKDMTYSVLGERSVQLSPNPNAENNSYQFQVAVSVNEFSPGGNYRLIFFFSVMTNPTDPLTVINEQFVVNMNVTSDSTPGANYGKLLGVFDVDLSPEISAIFTFLIWLGIALLILLAIRPVLKRASEKIGYARRVERIGTSVSGLVLVYGATQSAYIGVRGLLALSLASKISVVLYAVILSIIIWDVYCILVSNYGKKKGFPEDSLVPLGIAIGKIFIVVLSVGYIMTTLGIDWTYVMTSMGILGLVLGIGAQSTLAQFFGGLSILGTRPFKPGDIVRMDDSQDMMIVLDVGFMVTKFKNWANSEIFTIPNERVVSSTIVNVTKGTRHYRVTIVVRVKYESDINLAKKLVMEAAMEHPHVLTDGSVPIPSVRLSELADSSMNLTLWAYIDNFEDHYIYSGEIREAIYKKFSQNGIAVAYPRVDVGMVDEE